MTVLKNYVVHDTNYTLRPTSSSFRRSWSMVATKEALEVFIP